MMRLFQLLNLRSQPSVVPGPPTGFGCLVFYYFLLAFLGASFVIWLGVSTYRLLVRVLCGCSSGGASSDGGDGLSAERRKEIDDLRSVAIRRHLKEFTATLTENDVSSEQLATTCSSANDNSAVEDEEQRIDIDEESANDIAEETNCNEEQSPRLSTPLLAHGLDGSSMMMTESSSRQQTYSDKLQCCNECSICCEEYQPKDKICWSSNAKCVHIFHEECIVHWLLSLGWIRWKEQKVHDRLLVGDDKELLMYDLECPLCRLDFVDKSLFTDERGEASLENVV